MKCPLYLISCHSHFFHYIPKTPKYGCVQCLKSRLVAAFLILSCFCRGLTKGDFVRPGLLFWPSSSVARLPSNQMCRQIFEIHSSIKWLIRRFKLLKKKTFEYYGCCFISFFVTLNMKVNTFDYSSPWFRDSLQSCSTMCADSLSPHLSPLLLLLSQS